MTLHLTVTMAINQNNFNNMNTQFVSFNMHGFNQGCDLLKDLVCSDATYIISIQEHWLTPDKLSVIQNISSDYIAFCSSAMSARVSAGPLYGRPFGGLAVLVHKSFAKNTKCILSNDRLIALLINGFLLINIYMPSVGTDHRSDLVNLLTSEISSLLSHKHPQSVVLLGDFNCLIETLSDGKFFTGDRDCLPVCNLLNDVDLHDILHDIGVYFNSANATYVDAYNRGKRLDYIFISQQLITTVQHFEVIDAHNNFSDHYPISATLQLPVSMNCPDEKTTRKLFAKPRLRWDHADLGLYYSMTEIHLRPLFVELTASLPDNFDEDTLSKLSCPDIDLFFTKLISSLKCAAFSVIPFYSKDVAKSWWNSNLSQLKAKSLMTDRTWKSNGKPLDGDLFDARRVARLEYRSALREARMQSASVVSDRMQSSLSCKQGKSFWSVWRANFGRSRSNRMSGVNSSSTCHEFAKMFAETCSVQKNNSSESRRQFLSKRSNYTGMPFDLNIFDVEVIEKAIKRLRVGTAPGVDGISVEHIIYSHPILISILRRLFYMMLYFAVLPESFCQSYIVPIPKSKTNVDSCANYRGISITCVLAKIFEACLIDSFSHLLASGDQQFGFKKDLGTSHAIFTLRKVIERFTLTGNTVNVCTLDISKAFDKVDHDILLMKLMNRKIPAVVIDLLDNWLKSSFARVKWNDFLSDKFRIECGVRQGSCFSPILFAVYIDEVINLLEGTLLNKPWSLILYADDIILISLSLTRLQRNVNSINDYFNSVGLMLNSMKSSFIRIGPRCSVSCEALHLENGEVIVQSDHIVYLGVRIEQCKRFKCTFDRQKASFARATNGIFSVMLGKAPEDCILYLLKMICLPMLLYAIEAVPLAAHDIQSFDFWVIRFLYKLFHSFDKTFVLECIKFFGFAMPSNLICLRREKFITKYLICDNSVCRSVNG
jgi:exonuclease III